MKISNALLTRNTLLNFFGQIVPLFVGVITIPFIVRGLGTERFGLLSLAWVILGYFTLFDFGLGRATTKFVAEAIGRKKRDEIPRLLWTAVTIQAILGIAGTFALIGITPLFVKSILNIPPYLIDEARNTFYLLAFSIPVILISGSFRGLLEAEQRFDLVNLVKVPSSILIFLLPLLGVLLGLNLTGIIALIICARLGALAAFVMINLRSDSSLRKYSGTFDLFPTLFGYGGWITVSSVAGPILVYLDRFLIGAFLTMASLAYYSAPYEAISRLSIIPLSMTMTMFPAFSALEGVKNRQKLAALLGRSIKYIALVLGPLVLTIGLFSSNILRIWLGEEFALNSTLVLQLFAFGILINSFAHPLYSFLQGVGRADIPAKFHLLELPIYVGMAWFLIMKWGIVGAALAWVLRVILDFVLQFIAVSKIFEFPPRLLLSNGTSSACFALIVLSGFSLGIKTLVNDFSLIIQVLFLLVPSGLFIWFSWKNSLDGSDKRMIASLIKLLKRRKAEHEKA
jgi:O-antigen/teichoic acid export membrane protein